MYILGRIELEDQFTRRCKIKRQQPGTREWTERETNVSFAGRSVGEQHYLELLGSEKPNDAIDPDNAHVVAVH